MAKRSRGRVNCVPLVGREQMDTSWHQMISTEGNPEEPVSRWHSEVACNGGVWYHRAVSRDESTLKQ